MRHSAPEIMNHAPSWMNQFAFEGVSVGAAPMLEGWGECSVISPIERVWNRSRKQPLFAFSSSHQQAETAPMNFNHPQSFATSDRVNTKTPTKKMTLLAARAINEGNTPPESKPLRHRWSQTTIVERAPLPFDEPSSPHLLKTKEAESGEITQTMLVSWCVIITLTSLLAVIL